jgi:hypothetical protein
VHDESPGLSKNTWGDNLNRLDSQRPENSSRCLAGQPATGKWQKRLINFRFLSLEISYDWRLLEKTPGAASLKTKK